jgi:Tfp pilus assembly protein FimV
MPYGRQCDLPGCAARHWNHPHKAALHLGKLLQEEGDTDGARVAYQQAMDRGRGRTAREARRLLRDIAPS